MNNQCKRVFDYIKRFGSITTHQAFIDLGIMRLSARIYELREYEHYQIEKETIAVKNRFGEVCHIAKYFFPVKKCQMDLF